MKVLIKKLQTGLHSHKRVLFSWIAMFLFPIVNFYLFDGYTHNPFTTMKVIPQLLNILFFELLLLFLFGLFGQLRTALLIQTLFFMLVGLANYFVLSFRSAPILPWDIYSVRTAASVAGGFSYRLEPLQWKILAGFLCLLLLETKCRLSLKGQKPYRRLLLLFVPFLLLFGFTSMLHQETCIRRLRLYDKLFTPAVMSKRCGNSVAFLMELKYISVEKPKDYRPEDAARLLASYAADDSAAIPEKHPNIIVVMNEAFSDLSVLGDFETSEDYMPFFHSLAEGTDNAITGWLNVSVLGGNTANTEFEFLTGHTMAFLPQGSVAYQQYVKSASPAMPSHLKELGYRTIAMHPYYASGWDRNRVYPLLGFDEMYFLDDFESVRYLRKYADDQTCAENIIRLYENKGNEPLFIFQVTMQNHSPYTEEFDNFQADVHASNAGSQTLDNYLSLIRRSDQSLADLVSYFEDAEEDTIIVFFGDHQPTMSVSRPIRRLNHADTDHLSDEENSLYYKVPFAVWANFDITEETQLETSPGFLGANVLTQCALPLTPYENFLIHLQKEYAAVSSQTVIKSSDSFSGPDNLSGSADELSKSGDAPMHEYQSLQYYLLFDWKEEP